MSSKIETFRAAMSTYDAEMRICLVLSLLNAMSGAEIDEACTYDTPLFPESKGDMRVYELLILHGWTRWRGLTWIDDDMTMRLWRSGKVPIERFDQNVSGCGVLIRKTEKKLRRMYQSLLKKTTLPTDLVKAIISIL